MSNDRLYRAVGKWSLTALAVNGIVGAGIFGLPSRTYALAGAWSLLAFIVCAGLAILIALAFAEVGSRFRDTGGPYLYAREAFGATTGFVVGWLWWISRAAAYAANIKLLVSYSALLVPVLTQPQAQTVAIVLTTAALLVLNIAGVRESTLASNVLTVTKISLLVLFVCIGLMHIDTGNFHWSSLPQMNNISTAVLLLVYAFTGFEMVAVAAGEAENPQRDLPRALLLAVTIVAVLYVGIQAVCIGTLPALAESQRPLADAAQHFAGSFGGTIIVAGAVVSILGNLNLVLLSSSRLPFAMAEWGDLPRWLSNIHGKRKTPYAALLLTTAVVLPLALSGSFLGALTISSASRLIAYGATAAAVLWLRNRSNVPPAMLRIPAARLVIPLTMVLIVWLLLHTSQAEAIQTALLTIIGIAVFAATKWRKNRRLLQR